jgi:Fe(3+) dicitrate transport protein
VLGIEPRYTQRLSLLGTTQDVTVGYRFLRERADESVYNQVLATGVLQPMTSFFYNTTDAHSFYIDDRIALGNWRVTPGIRYENIEMARLNQLNGQDFELTNNKALPSLAVAYLATQDLTLFTNYGTSFGEVQNTQLNSQTAANPLQPELAKTIELGARLKRSGLSAEATLFHIRFDNQIQQVGTGLNPTFINVGETRHEGIETAVDYSFDKAGSLAGLNLFANYTHTRATLESGDNVGNDVPFYSRDTDTVGARYTLGRWAFNLSSTHQSRQFADNANTVAESAAGDNGVIPGFRVWNAQLTWKPPGFKGLELVAGANNLTDRQYFTRTTDGNRGKLGGAPRLTYIQGRYAF